jgi:hypothetical protein
MAKRRIRKRRPQYVRVNDFKRLADAVNELAELVHKRCADIDVQFKRIAAMQAELDQLRGGR